MYLPWHNTDLGSCKEVHFKQPGLQMIFGWSVVLKGIQKERSTCLNLVCFHKYIYNLKIAKEQFEKRMLGLITEEWIWSMLSRCSPKPVPNLICYEKFGENSEAYQQVLLVPLPFQSSFIHVNCLLLTWLRSASASPSSWTSIEANWLPVSGLTLITFRRRKM